MARGPYIRIAGQLEVQVSALTGAGSIGNYNTHAVARIVHGDRVYEVPVMTGNAMKHWHAYYTAQVYQSLGGQKLNEFCRKGIGLRGYTVNSNLTNPQTANSENQAIEDLCNDLHGFLIPREERPVKRDSLIRFSFVIPVLDEKNLEIVSKFAVVHNRVDPRPLGKEETQMMVFKQEYASAFYGFNSSLDLAYVCKPLYEEVPAESGPSKEIQKSSIQQEEYTKCDDNEASLRVRSAVLAFIDLLLGPGAKQARALPILKVKELFAVLANKPIPNVIGGAYPDYMKKSTRILADYYSALSTGGSKDDVLELKVYCYSESAEKCSNLYDEWQNMIKTSEKGETFKVYDSFSRLIKELADDSVKYVSSR